MAALKNQQHETFAKHLAKGKSMSQAYADAGYHRCRQSASRLSAKADIKQRVAELQTQAAAPPDLDGRDETSGKFLTGNSRGGRPKGSRNKLAEAFVADLYGEWQRSGSTALRTVAQTDPAAFLKVAASVLPRLIDTTVHADLFIECRTFAEAFRLARDHIGADAPLLIEAEAND